MKGRTLSQNAVRLLGETAWKAEKRLEDTVMMDLQEVGCEDLRWMDLADDIVR